MGLSFVLCKVSVPGSYWVPVTGEVAVGPDNWEEL